MFNMKREGVLPGFQKTQEQLEQEKTLLIGSLQAAANLPVELRSLVGIVECLKPEEAELVRSLVRRATQRVRAVAAAVAQLLT